MNGRKMFLAAVLASAFCLSTASVSEAGIWKKVKRGVWNQLKKGVGVKIDSNGVRPAGGVSTSPRR
jgi:hypothetical protein